MDYDHVGKSTEEKSEGQVIPVPRNAIFIKYFSRTDKSCPSGDQARVTKHVINYENSCPNGTDDSEPPSYSAVINKRISHSHDRTCFAADADQPSKTESTTRVSSYSSNIDGQVDYLANEKMSTWDNTLPSRKEVGTDLQEDSDWQGYNYDPNALPYKDENRNKRKRRRNSVFYRQQDVTTIKRKGSCFHITDDGTEG